MTIVNFPSENIILLRVRSGEDGTFGHLLKGGSKIGVTCEDPWRENRRGESCIPKGRYLCVPHNGAKYKNVWEVSGVPGRSAILIHHGNTIKDTQGCILVGESFGVVANQPAIIGSKNMLKKLREILPAQFTLTIQEQGDKHAT